MLPYGRGQYLNADQIVTIADANDGTPITVTMTAGAPIIIDPQLNTRLAFYLRHRLGYVPVANPNAPPPPWNPSPPMPQ